MGCSVTEYRCGDMGLAYLYAAGGVRLHFQFVASHETVARATDECLKSNLEGLVWYHGEFQ